MAIPCTAFTDFLSRKSEHLDDNIISSLHPTDTWIGHVSTGRFAAEDGVEHTFDRFENVFPDLSSCWEDVTATSCVGKPCDPTEQKIGLGFTRDSYKLQRKAYATDLFCFDQILSADRAKRQFAHIIRTLRRASSLIVSDRMRREASRIAKYKWVATSGLTAASWYWNTDCTILNVSALPTSKMTARHLQRRVEPQILEGALGEDINRGSQPMLEYVSSMEEVWNMVEGSPELSDHWRFQQWEDASKYQKYGWVGKVGNFGLRADSMPLRFCDKNTQNADGTWQLQLILPYTNVAATEGIKEQVNSQFLDAPIQMNYIWHRMAMTSLVRDTTAINPEMPFAARDFAGKWKAATTGLTCGVDVNGNPIAVDNSRGNKLKMLADFSFATQAQYPEFAEAFLALREPACVVDIPRCATTPVCYVQDYSSANAECSTDDVVLTFTPDLNGDTSTYEVAMNTIACNGMLIVHDAITGAASLATLAAQLNTKAASLGTWAVSGGDITLTGTACSSASIPWIV